MAVVKIKGVLERGRSTWLAGMVAGAATATALGALAGSAWPDLTRAEGALIGFVLGLAVGGIIGEVLRERDA